ncbi:MAG TPA: tetratricopeptide repeat protein [Acidobacteriaceae bacterium]|jgi:tetratricopeptide (TPR) repeat protein|nr:tetratricopeptide repeat protein [Acidobacteriaceae bacterium]
MALRSAAFLVLVACASAFASFGFPASAQTAQATPQALVQHGVQLVESGHCAEALPLLQRGLPHISDKAQRYHAQMALVRCAMALGQEQVAADTLFQLQRDAPGDPEVLYVETHLFSEMGERAAQELQAKDPASYQQRRLEAETLESQGKNDEAAALYREILRQNPKLPGIHYRLGQIDLAIAGDSGPTDAAKQEFEQELAIDPTDASAEFILGELARRKGDWDQAVEHFTRAAHLDSGFSEAYLALGMSLAASGKFADAKAPLEHYVKLEPDDPSGHYQLAQADAHTGDTAGAQREMALQAQAAARAKSSTDSTQGHPVQP